MRQDVGSLSMGSELIDLGNLDVLECDVTHVQTLEASLVLEGRTHCHAGAVLVYHDHGDQPLHFTDRILRQDLGEYYDERKLKKNI